MKENEHEMKFSFYFLEFMENYAICFVERLQCEFVEKVPDVYGGALVYMLRVAGDSGQRKQQAGSLCWKEQGNEPTTNAEKAGKQRIDSETIVATAAAEVTAAAVVGGVDGFV